MFRNTFKIFTLNGFEIKLDPSWFIIAALVTWSLSQHYFPFIISDQPSQIYLLMGLVAMILFFSSLLLHELAHSVVARRFGVEIKGITLFLFGGVAELQSEPQSARIEFWIAIAGPVMSLCLGLSFGIAANVIAAYAQYDAIVAIFQYLAIVNAFLAVFNLIPAFPLDGGRILRAYLWHRNGDVLRATELASKAGAVFGYVLMGLGLFALFQGAFVTGIWQMLIGGFLLSAARSSYQHQLASMVFDNKTVGSLLKPNTVIVGPDASLFDFVNDTILGENVSFVPVVENGVLLGHIDKSVVLKIDRENWANTHVGDVFSKRDDKIIVGPDLPVKDLMNTMSQTGIRKFLVATGTHLVGVVSLSDLTRYLQMSDILLHR